MCVTTALPMSGRRGNRARPTLPGGARTRVAGCAPSQTGDRLCFELSPGAMLWVRPLRLQSSEREKDHHGGDVKGGEGNEALRHLRGQLRNAHSRFTAADAPRRSRAWMCPERKPWNSVPSAGRLIYLCTCNWRRSRSEPVPGKGACKECARGADMFALFMPSKHQRDRARCSGVGLPVAQLPSTYLKVCEALSAPQPSAAPRMPSGGTAVTMLQQLAAPERASRRGAYTILDQQCLLADAITLAPRRPGGHQQ